MSTTPRLRAVLLACVAPLLLAACASSGPADGDDAVGRMLATPVVLLGEVHDNAAGHTARAELLARAVARGWRPAIAMEQFDRERQADLDAAMRACGDAGCVIRAASPVKTGWDWKLYEPVIALALRERLPLVAANLSRTDAGKVVRQGVDAAFDRETVTRLGLDRPPAPLLAAQEKEVADSHCGKLPASMHAGMATAQMARDAAMALAIDEAGRTGAARRPVVLLAGNGHVRRDLGVAQWLRDTPAFAVGFVEAPPAPGLYDRSVVVPPAARPDPCEAFGGRG